MSRYRVNCKYTVYDNRTDAPVIVCAEAQECADAIGVALGTFYAYLTPSGKSREHRWTIIKEGRCADFHDDPSIAPKTMGQHMTLCRLKRGLTRPQLAKLSGVHSTNIRNYETDTAFPTITSVISIADALNVSIDELIGRKVK